MLPLFPSAYIDNSLLTAVLIGLILVWLLGERLGWPQTGLVVPGYLGAVFLIQPSAGAVICAEAVLTYLGAHVLGRWLPTRSSMDVVFGRDRFFLIILVSVLVRLAVEAGPLAAVLDLGGIGGGRAWHSLGLVIVPLAANAMWKTGVLRGGPLMGLPILAVYLLLRFVVVPGTNLNLTRFELTYEDLAWSFAASPRSYILLLAGAFLASHMTVRFGWDFGGIIICGLVAVTWIDPAKLVATMGEVLIIVLVMRLLLTATPLRHVNMTKLRPVVLGFVISYALKLALAWGFQGLWPGFRVSDLFGFGYLLPALLAVRSWRKGSLILVLGPTLAVSLVAFAGGTAVGYALERVRPAGDGTLEVHENAVGAARARDLSLRALLPHGDRPSPLAAFELGTAAHSARQGAPWTGEKVVVAVHSDGAVVYAPEEPVGVTWLRAGATLPLEIRVPHAATEPGLAEAAVVIADALGAAVLALSPSSRAWTEIHDPNRGVIELDAAGRSELIPGQRLPETIDLSGLTGLIPDLGLTLNGQAASGTGHTRLTLSEDALLTVALSGMPDPAPDAALPRSRGGGASPPLDPLPPLYGEAAPASDPTERPDPGDPSRELAWIDRGVLLPLLRARTGDARWLQLAAATARQVGLAVGDSGQVLTLSPSEPGRWHTTLWLRTEGEAVAFEVPAAGRQVGTAELARQWWSATDAMALVAHDGTREVDPLSLQREGPTSLETLILRRLALAEPGLRVLSLTAATVDEYPDQDAILSDGRPRFGSTREPVDYRIWRTLIEGTGGTVAHYDGSLERVRFYDPGNARRAAVEVAGGSYVTAFLRPTFREGRGAPLDGPLASVLGSAGFALEDGDVDSLARGVGAAPADWATAIAGTLARFGATGHPADLQRVRRTGRATGVQTRVVVDVDDGRPYLVASAKRRRLVVPLLYASGDVVAAGPGRKAIQATGDAVSVEDAP